MSSNALAVQKIPSLKKFPFRSRFDLSFTNSFTCYPGLVTPICKTIKLEVGDTADISIDLSLVMLYLQNLVLDGLQADVYTFYTTYGQTYNKYERVKGERLSVVSDEHEYCMSRITSIYPICWKYGNAGIASTIAHAMIPQWNQDGETIKPKIFDITTGENIDPVPQWEVYPVTGSTEDSVCINGYHLSGDKYSNRQLYEGMDDGHVGTYTLGFMPGSLPDYLGYPVGVPNLAFVAAPIIAYYLACDYYFRQAEIFDSIVGIVPDVDVDRPWNIWCEWQGMVAQPDYRYGSLTAFFTPYAYAYNQQTDHFSDKLWLNGLGPGGLYRASRKPDYQALGLAAPTYKGLDVYIPGQDRMLNYIQSRAGATIAADGDLNFRNGGNTSNKEVQYNGSANLHTYENDGNHNYRFQYVSGLKANFNAIESGSAAAIASYGTMQELRTGFQMLKYLEAKNRAGKYIGDIIENFFGIHDPAPDQRFPELLSVLSGGFSLESTENTQASTSSSPQGQINMNASCRIVGKCAHVTAKRDSMIQILMVIRQPSITFEDRIDPYLFQFREMDFMNPLFALLGDQPVKNHEVYVPATPVDAYMSMINRAATSDQSSFTVNLSTDNWFPAPAKKVINDMFKPNSYQERYGELKYAFNQVAGLFHTRAYLCPTFQEPVFSDYRKSGNDFYCWNNHLNDGDNVGVWCRQLTPLSNMNYSLSFDKLKPAAARLNVVGRDVDSSQTSGEYVKREDPRLAKALTPWYKSAYSLTYHPIIGQVRINYKVDRILPVSAAPGLADHL